VPSGLVCVAVHERNKASSSPLSSTLAASVATSPSPVVNGSATVEAWTRLLLPRHSSSSLSHPGSSSSSSARERLEIDLAV